MTQKEIAQNYIDFLQNGEIQDIISLFSKKGKVTSPLYGTLPASDFYTLLNDDTTSSNLTLKGIFEDQEHHNIAIYFNYEWTLKNNENVSFDVVDIIEFNNDNKIEHLHIIYDTVNSRRLLSELKN